MTTDEPSPIAGRSVLVAEDEALLAAELEAVLESAGALVVGMASDVAQGLKILENEHPEAAVLDLNLGGEVSAPLAAALKERNVPFVILTGYGDSWMLFQDFLSAPVAEKPVDHDQLMRFLGDALSRSDANGAAG